MCPLKGRDILEGLEELPSRNISVRALSSIPSVKANSTDLKILKQKGLYITLLFLVIFIFYHFYLSAILTSHSQSFIAEKFDYKVKMEYLMIVF